MQSDVLLRKKGRHAKELRGISAVGHSGRLAVFISLRKIEKKM